MRICIKNNFFKKNLKFSLIITMSVFLSACESIPSKTSKPVFKIANFPSLKQKKENVNNNGQKVNQSKTEKEADLVNTNALNKATQPEKTTLDVVQQEENNNSDQKVNQSKTEKEADLVNTNALNKATQPEKTTLDVVQQEERKNNYQKTPEEMVDQNAFTSLPDSKESKIQDNQLLDNNDLAFAKDYFENKKTKTDIENFDREILEFKTRQENKIASLTNIPQAPMKPPPIKKIKINSLINVKVENLESVLGKPNFVIFDEGMNLWQYEFGKCIVDFFLKFNENNYSVVFIDIRATELGYITDMTTCENELSTALNR